MTLNSEEVQRWVTDASQNRGIIVASSTADDGMSIATSEHQTTAFRPKLTVTYANY